jgi:ketosteroid isomerase-like protein
MSQENVKLVREAFAAFAHDGPEAMAAFWDPDVEVQVPTDLADAGTYRGRAAVLGWIMAWDEAWEEISYTPEELLDAGDVVLTTVLYDGRGKGSGVRIDGRFWYLMVVRDEKIQSLQLFGDRAEALEAAGVSE